MQRKIYIILGILSLIAPLIISLLINNFLTQNILQIYIVYIIFYMIYFIINIIYSGIIYESDLFDNLLFFFMPFTLGRKKIYYSEIGYFYIKFKDDKVYLFKQNSFKSKFLFSVNYTGDNEILRKNIKFQLDNYYKEDINAKNIKKNFKIWNGYIDKQSERDDKLNKIL